MLQGNELTAVAAVALSLIVSYVPTFQSRFAKLDAISKRLVMGILILLVAGGSVVWNCNFQASCLQALDFRALVGSVVVALIANQSMYQLSPASSKKVKGLNR